MKFCRLCGLNYDDNVLFCPNCQRNLEELPPEEADGAFTPSGDYETDAQSQISKGRSSEPAPDYETCMQKEVENARKISESGILKHEIYPEEQQPEINHAGEIPTLNKEQKPCARCGTMNPHNQTFCTYCGAEVSMGGLPTSEEYSPKYYTSPPSPPVPPPIPSSEIYTPSFSSPPPGDCSADYKELQKPHRLLGGGEGRVTSSLNALTEWSAWKWVGLFAAVIILCVLIWFFFYGGRDLLFNSGIKNIREASETMSKLPSYEYTLDLTFDSATSGQFKGEGKLLFESPDKTSWAINIHTPAGAVLQPRGIQIGTNQFLDAGSGMKSALLNTQPVDAFKLWTGYSGFENLPDQDLNGQMCHHYKYRIPPKIFTTAVGIADSQGIGDAVMEIWIDAGTNRIIQIKATVYDLNIGGIKADATIIMVLSATDLQYNIQAPAQ